MDTVQISFTFKEGVKPADIAQKLRWHAGLLEGLAPKEAASVKNTAGGADEEKLDSVPAPKKRSAKQRIAAAFGVDDVPGPGIEEPKDEPEVKEMPDDEIEDDLDAQVEVDDDFTEAPKAVQAAKKKEPVVDLKAVNEACKAKMQAAGGGKAGRDAVLAILKKKFKTQTLSELDPSQYAAVVKAVQV